MAKKAKAASWRTLSRQADKERSPRKASELRKQAWSLRRAERAAKGTKKAPAARRNIVGAKRAARGWAAIARAASDSAGMKQLRDQVQNATTRVSAGVDSLVRTTTDRGAPGRGEVVGGAFADVAERIAKLVRKKGGMNGVYNELAALAESSKYEGCVETDKAATKRLIEVQKMMAGRIVCGFIAEVEQAINEHRGMPPSMTWVLNSYLITKIVDALNEAGYSASGMKDVGSAKGYDKESL